MANFEGNPNNSGNKDVNILATQERIAHYRGAANREHDIHQFTVAGKVQREVTTAPGEPINPHVMDSCLVGYDAGGSKVATTYAGIMSPEACTEIADHLAAQITSL